MKEIIDTVGRIEETKLSEISFSCDFTFVPQKTLKRKGNVKDEKFVPRKKRKVKK